MKKIRIEITDDETGENWPLIEFECDNFSISEERGHREVFDPIRNRIAEIISTGKYRLALKAWRGCSSFESFVGREKTIKGICKPK